MTTIHFLCQKLLKNRKCPNFLMVLQGVIWCSLTMGHVRWLGRCLQVLWYSTKTEILFLLHGWAPVTVLAWWSFKFVLLGLSHASAHWAVTLNWILIGQWVQLTECEIRWKHKIFATNVLLERCWQSHSTGERFSLLG